MSLHVKLSMEPRESSLDLTRTALLIIDMQRDFLEPGGFGEILGNNVAKLARAVAPCKTVLELARQRKLLVIHTREGHRPDMTDVNSWKLDKNATTKKMIGETGPMGRILIRGEPGHDIIPELYPVEGEPIIDKPGKGAFYQTDLSAILSAKGIATVLVCGVTSEVCVHSTIREGNDRGLHMIAVSDACASFFDDFHESAMMMIKAQGGIFGSVTTSEQIKQALSSS